MTVHNARPTPELKRLILLDSRNFLISIQAGASREHLVARLIEIKRQETHLMRNEQIMLHPHLWRILLSHFANRKDREIIDTLE